MCNRVRLGHVAALFLLFQTISPSPTAPQSSDERQLAASFQGIGDEVGRSPDTMIAASVTTLVIVWNQGIAIRTKTGELTTRTTIGNFFGRFVVPGTEYRLTDPAVIFDPESLRFFVANAGWVHDPQCEPGKCNHQILLAVSKNPNPITLDDTDWYFYALDRTLERTPQGSRYTLVAGDFDHIATTRDVLAIGWQGVTIRDHVGGGGKIRIIDKQKLVNGGPVDTWTDYFDLPDRPRPAFTFGETDRIFFDIHAKCGTNNRQTWTIGAVSGLPSNPSFAMRAVATDYPCASSMLEAPQNGGPPIDVVHLNTQPVYRDGRLWVAGVFTHTFRDRPVTVIRWAELDVTRWPDAVTTVQTGTFGEDNLWYYAPAFMVDHAMNFAMVYTMSGPDHFPSAYYTYRLATDPPGRLRTGVPLKRGEMPFTFMNGGRNRFVDYTSAAFDPADQSIWLTGFYSVRSPTFLTSYAHTWVGNLPLVPRPMPTEFFRRQAGTRSMKLDGAPRQATGQIYRESARLRAAASPH